MVDDPVAVDGERTSSRLLLDSIVDFEIVGLDLDGVITSWSVGAERLLQYTADEAVGRPVSMLYPDEEVDAGRPGLELRMAADAGRFEAEGWRVRKDGSRFWAWVSLAPIRDADGVPCGYVRVARDITSGAPRRSRCAAWRA